MLVDEEEEVVGMTGVCVGVRCLGSKVTGGVCVR